MTQAQTAALEALTARHERLAAIDGKNPSDSVRRRNEWLAVSTDAARLADELDTGEEQDLARHYAIQAAFRAHDGKRAWELSVGWGLTGSLNDAKE